MSNRAFITGIAGFAGSYLAELLIEEGLEVAGSIFPGESTRNIDALKDHLGLCVCDVRDADAVARAISTSSPDEIYHLAAITFIPESVNDPRLTFETNLFGTINVFEAAKTVGEGARVLFVGSADEYGLVGPKDLPIGEQTPLRPLNPYSVSKASAGMLAYQYAFSGGLHVVRVRPFNHTGPRQSPRFVCSDFARQIVEAEKGVGPTEMSVGNLRPRRDFSDVRDVVRAYRDVLRGGETGEVYNVCSGSSKSIREILEMLFELSGCTLDIVERSDRARKSDVEEITGDYAKIEKAIGWRPAIAIEKTLGDLIEYWRENI
jgi:GDP-4-dehydro-6-deoxy-D-mannose reductase